MTFGGYEPSKEEIGRMKKLSKQGRCAGCGSGNYYDVCDRGTPSPHYPEGLLFCGSCWDSIHESYESSVHPHLSRPF